MAAARFTALTIELRRVAYHEAGHAVMLYLLRGGPVGQVMIRLQGHRLSGLACMPGRWGCAMTGKAHALHAGAGEASEYILTAQWDKRRLDPRWAGPDSDIRSAQSHAKNRHELLDLWQRQAVDLLRNPPAWSAVEAVATILVRRMIRRIKGYKGPPPKWHEAVEMGTRGQRPKAVRMLINLEMLDFRVTLRGREATAIITAAMDGG